MSTLDYLTLLNAIAVNERQGARLFNAWAEVTADAQLAATLRFVAIREEEHAAAFTKRLCELGHAVNEAGAYQAFDDFEGLLACVRSDAPDADKVARVRRRKAGEDPARDPHRGFFSDHRIDPDTGALLGRFIAEERDSTRRLEAEYERIELAAAPRIPEAVPEHGGTDIDQLRACIDALRRDIAELKGARRVA